MEQIASILLLCDHMHGNMRKLLFCNLRVGKIIDFLEAGDEEDSQNVIITFHDVLDQVLLKEGMVCNNLLKIFRRYMCALAVLHSFHSRSSLATE